MSKRILILLLFVFSGCSNKGVYEQIQTNNRVECGRLPASQYDECVESNKMPYDEYERRRRETLNK